MSTPVLIGGRAIVAAPLTAARHHYAAAVLRRAGVFQALAALPKGATDLEAGTAVLDALALSGSTGKLIAALVTERTESGEPTPFSVEAVEELAAFLDSRESAQDQKLLTVLAGQLASAFFRNTPPSSATSAESSRPTGAPGVAIPR